MGVSVTNLGRSGLSDWLIQRFTAVVMLAYTLFLVGFVIANPDVQYQEWKNLFATGWVKIFSLLTLISVCAHAWIGMWTASTDYMKGTAVRFLFQAVCFVAIFSYLVWGIDILWSV